MLHAALLRVFLLFNLSQIPTFPSFNLNSTGNALAVVINLPRTLPLYLYKLGLTSKDASSPGLKRRGLGFSPFSHEENAKNEGSATTGKDLLEKLSEYLIPATWPRDLVKRPSAQEARKKALIWLPEAHRPAPMKILFDQTKSVIENQFTVDMAGHLATTSQPSATRLTSDRLHCLAYRYTPAPCTPVVFVPLGPWTLLRVLPGDSSNYAPEVSDETLALRMIFISCIPALLTFYLNPRRVHMLLSQISALVYFVVHGLFCSPPLTDFRCPKQRLIAIFNISSDILSTFFIYVFVEDPILPQSYTLTAEELLRLVAEESRFNSSSEMLYTIPQRRWADSQSASTSSSGSDESIL